MTWFACWYVCPCVCQVQILRTSNLASSLPSGQQPETGVGGKTILCLTWQAAHQLHPVRQLRRCLAALGSGVEVEVEDYQEGGGAPAVL